MFGAVPTYIDLCISTTLSLSVRDITLNFCLAIYSLTLSSPSSSFQLWLKLFMTWHDGKSPKLKISVWTMALLQWLVCSLNSNTLTVAYNTVILNIIFNFHLIHYLVHFSTQFINQSFLWQIDGFLNSPSKSLRMDMVVSLARLSCTPPK